MKLALALILLCSLAVANVSNAQCNAWDNLLTYEGVYPSDVAVDRFGNSYIVGWFNNPAFNIGATYLPLQGNFSMYVIKFSKDRVLQWAKSVSNSSQVMPVEAKIDNKDNLIVAGYFFTSNVFFDCIELVAASRSEMFVVKYSPNGTVSWATGSRGMEDGFLAELEITKSNEVIVSSTFVSGDVTFGNKSFHGFGGYDSFVSRLTENGDVNWVKEFGGPGSDSYNYICGITLDSNENILITGFFGTPDMLFGKISVSGFTISENYFIAKLNTSGETLWAKGGEKSTNQSAFGIGVDKMDNIIVAGRFYNDASFGNFQLTHVGETTTSDVFIVKYNTNGVVLGARSFGGDGYDSPSSLEIDRDGHAIVSGYYYSYDFIVDTFIKSKTEFESDAFVITLDDQLTAQCFKRISGSSENGITAISIDRENNIWVVSQNNFGNGDTNFDDDISLQDGSPTHQITSIGNSKAFDAQESSPFHFDINLGPDLTKCESQNVVLRAGSFCSASYAWNTGETDPTITVLSPGTYWVDVTINSETERDSLNVSNIAPLTLELGADRAICPGEQFTVDARQDEDAYYLWNDGVTSPTRQLNTPGNFMVTVTGTCETRLDDIMISLVPKLKVDLGNDLQQCSGQPVNLSSVQDGEVTYMWQDGSQAAALAASTSGDYTLTVSNACESATDMIHVTMITNSASIIPNVITPNGDPDNQFLVLPQEFNTPALTIFNRWGNVVFQSDHYDNTWDANNLPSGTYFINVRTLCLDDYKGLLSVLK
ncbi:MAG: gliding motility-associated C-terminal domain-containing protein [Chryseolinea sp.]